MELNERDVVFCCVRREMEIEERFVEGFILMNRRLLKIHLSDVPGWTSPRRKVGVLPIVGRRASVFVLSKIEM